MTSTPYRSVRIVLGILIGAIALYAVSLSMPSDWQAVLPQRTVSTSVLRADVDALQEELATTYIALTQRYLAEENRMQAMATIDEAIGYFPNNIDLLRLQADLQTNY